MGRALKAKIEVDPGDVGMPAVISEQIRKLITIGALSPGVHLGQTELAEQFSTSRMPVREALKLLAAEGMVTHDPNRGFFVAEVSSDEAEQLYRMRHLVEGELLSTIEWPNAGQLARLIRMEVQLEKHLAAGERSQWQALHREFNRAIFNLSPRKVLVRETERLWALTDRYRSLLPPPRAGDIGLGEPALIKALEHRDRSELLRVFHEDRDRIAQVLLSILNDRKF